MKVTDDEVKRWEYQIIKLEQNSGILSRTWEIDAETLQQTANQMGVQGWELVSPIALNGAHGVTTQLLLFFKKAINEA